MNKWTDGHCRANGINLHYLRTGGDKPAVLMLHGLMGSGACWTPLARTLADDYDVVMPDARGHGQSGAPPSGYGYEDQARDVIGLIAGLGLSAPILVGHSMGGMTAAVVASTAGRTIRGLALLDPTFLDPPRQQEVFESEVMAQHRQLLARDANEVLVELRSRHPDRARELVGLLADARLQTSIHAFQVLTPPNPDYRQLLRTIEVPILMLVGDAGVVSRDTATGLQRIHPQLQVEPIPNAGHGIHYDQPERVAAVLRSFLDSAARSSNDG